MPGYKGHLAGGLFFACMALVGAGMTGVVAISPLLGAGMIGFCLLGALFPDVDTDSKGQRLYYAVFVAIDLGLIWQKEYLWAAWLGLFSMLPALSAHRGWTHTWWAMIATPLPILLIPMFTLGADVWPQFIPFYASFVLGYFSHLLLDGVFS